MPGIRLWRAPLLGRWQRSGAMMAGPNHFLVALHLEELRNFILRGTRFFHNHMIGKATFLGHGNLAKISVNLLPVTVKVLDLDPIYHSQHALRLIGNDLGTFIQEMGQDLKHSECRVRRWHDMRAPIRFDWDFTFRGRSNICQLIYELLRGVCNTCSLLVHQSVGYTGPQTRSSPEPPIRVYPTLMEGGSGEGSFHLPAATQQTRSVLPPGFGAPMDARPVGGMAASLGIGGASTTSMVGAGPSAVRVGSQNPNPNPNPEVADWEASVKVDLRIRWKVKWA